MPVAMEEIINLVARQLGISKVRAEMHFVADLGAESADLVNLIAAVEDRFGVIIDEAELPEISTVADLQRLVDERSQH